MQAFLADGIVQKTETKEQNGTTMNDGYRLGTGYTFGTVKVLITVYKVEERLPMPGDATLWIQRRSKKEHSNMSHSGTNYGLVLDRVARIVGLSL